MAPATGLNGPGRLGSSGRRRSLWEELDFPTFENCGHGIGVILVLGKLKGKRPWAQAGDVSDSGSLSPGPWARMCPGGRWQSPAGRCS